MYQSVRNLWLTISLKKKLAVYSGMVILMLLLSAVFNLQLMNFALGHFRVILNDNSRCQDFQKAMELEVQAFERVVRERDCHLTIRPLVRSGMHGPGMCAMPMRIIAGPGMDLSEPYPRRLIM